MLVRCRKLLHSSLSSISPPSVSFRNPRSAPRHCCRLRLCPEIVDSTVSNCPSDTLTLSFFLWAARQPFYFHAATSFDRIVPVVLRLTLRFGLVSRIVRHLETFGCPIKAQTFLILLRIYWRAKKFRFALEVFDEMCRRNYKPNNFVSNIILDIQFRSGRFDEAMRIYGEAKCPNFLTFNIVLRNLCESGDWLRVRNLLRAMVRRGLFLNDGTFSFTMNCFCKAGRHAELLQLLAFMVVLGRHLSIMIWTILIDSFCRTGEVEMACENLRSMTETGCLPTIVTYTSLIRGLCEAQMLSEVVDILNIMCSNDCQPDIVLYNILIFYLLKTRRYDFAIDILILLLQRKMEPDSYTLSSLAFVFFSLRKVCLLFELTAGLKFKFDLVFYNSLITGFCKVCLPSEALRLYNLMIIGGVIPDSYSYVGLLSSLCKLGRTEHAVHIYYEILTNNSDVDAYVHSSILDGLVKNRKYHSAIKLFREVVSMNFCVDVVSYTIAVHALSKAGRFEEACDLFEQMKRFGPVPNIYTYNVMICGLCKQRDLDGTKKLLKEMIVRGIKMDHISVNVVTHLLIKLGQSNSALFMLKNMHDLCMSSVKSNYCALFCLFNQACIDDLDVLYSKLLYLEKSCICKNVMTCFDSYPELVSSGC